MIYIQYSVHSVSEYWRSGLSLDTPSRFLASAGTPVKHHCMQYACMELAWANPR